MDEMVLAAQQWLNSTYGGRSGFNTVTEDGKTGWQTMYALTRALQLELGITNTSDNFGSGTLSNLEAYGNISMDSNNDTENSQNANIIKIIQSGLYCKGYSAGAISGYFGSDTSTSIMAIQMAIGLSDPDGVVTPKLFKALLTMDAYIVVNNGSNNVRQVQQFLNDTYHHHPEFFFGPCDGHYSRDAQKALVYAIQYEIGLPPGVPNGNFGPMTQSELKKKLPLKFQDVDTNNNLVRLYQGSLIFNNIDVTFDDFFSLDVAQKTIAFQEFVKLPATGEADFQTWASLLVSTGDPNRKGSASDAITEITHSRGSLLKTNGYDIIGRYLTKVPGGLDKNLKSGEIQAIFDSNMSVFPIYQTTGNYSSYFSYAKGKSDAVSAFKAAREFGFEQDTTIYFAVDFDALDYQISARILPYYQGVYEKFRNLGGFYKVGVYGPRNVCIRVSDAGYAENSFVSGMSTGFSGNLGYPLPQNWAFDQISTVTLSGAGTSIEIDNNIASGRDNGANSVNPLVKDPEYMARHDALVDIISDMPFFNESPSLYTTEFTFNERVPLFSSHLASLELETETSFVMPVEDSVHTFKVVNGRFQVGSEGVFGDTTAQLDTPVLGEMEDMLDNVALSVGNGIVEIRQTTVGDKVELKITTYQDDIQVEGGGQVKLKVAVICTIDTPDASAPNYELWHTLGAGVVIIAALAALPAAAGVITGGTILAFLFGGAAGA